MAKQRQRPTGPWKGALIRDLRERKGLSQSQLAEMIGSTQRSITFWENDETRYPIKVFQEAMTKIEETMPDRLPI